MKTKEEIKQDFFSQFGNESFRGYPLEQCHSIWNFFEKYIGYTEEDMLNASKYGYEFRDTTSFPEHKFEDECINNTKQWLQWYNESKIKMVCPNCNNTENFHINYDYTDVNLPIEDILCNECGTFLNKINMKTQEEIEQLAEQFYPPTTTDLICSPKLVRIGYMNGYTQCQEDMSKELYEFGKLVLDTFHSEGRTHSGNERLPRIKFDEWFNELNKKD